MSGVQATEIVAICFLAIVFAMAQDWDELRERLHRR